MAEERDPNLPYDPKAHPFPRLLYRLLDIGYETREVTGPADMAAAEKQGWRTEHPELQRQRAAAAKANAKDKDKSAPKDNAPPKDEA